MRPEQNNRNNSWDAIWVDVAHILSLPVVVIAVALILLFWIF